jgi:hypothetical protein
MEGFISKTSHLTNYKIGGLVLAASSSEHEIGCSQQDTFAQQGGTTTAELVLQFGNPLVPLAITTSS